MMALCAVTVVCIACVTHDADILETGVLRHDSAGVEVVINLDSAVDTLSTITTELFRIGVADGAENQQFFGIRGIAAMSDGSLIVANNGTASIRLITYGGRDIRQLGRRGFGPGEFQAVYRPAVWGDSIHVSDDRRLYGTLLDKGGNVLATWRTLMSDGSLVEVLRGTSGGWIVEQLPFLNRGRANVGAEFRDPILIGRVSTLELQTLANLASDQLRVAIDPITSQPSTRLIGMATVEGVVLNSPFFEPIPHYAASSRHVYASNGQHYAIDVFDIEGNLVRKVARRYTPVAISPTDIEEVLRRASQYYSDPRHRGSDLRSIYRARAAMPHTPELPVTGRILVAEDETFWVERVDVARDPAAYEWSVGPPRATYWDAFTGAGVFQHMVRLAPEFTPHVLDGTVVVGVARDSLNVEYVVALRVSSR
jgi:hypothetical protein